MHNCFISLRVSWSDNSRPGFSKAKSDVMVSNTPKPILFGSRNLEGDRDAVGLRAIYGPLPLPRLFRLVLIASMLF